MSTYTKRCLSVLKFNKSTGLKVCASVAILFIGGCGDFFAEKPTQLESQNILREIAHVDLVPEVKNPIPEIYRQEPKIVESKIGDRTDARLFYFAKHHTAEKLATLITTQYKTLFLWAGPAGRLRRCRKRLIGRAR